jgi:hypothetical protein
MAEYEEVEPPATYNVSEKPWGIAEGERIKDVDLPRGAAIHRSGRAKRESERLGITQP